MQDFEFMNRYDLQFHAIVTRSFIDSFLFFDLLVSSHLFDTLLPIPPEPCCDFSLLLFVQVPPQFPLALSWLWPVFWVLAFIAYQLAFRLRTYYLSTTGSRTKSWYFGSWR